MKEKNWFQKIVTIGTMSTVSLITSDITQSDNDIIVGKHYDATIATFNDNNNNGYVFSCDYYCYRLPADLEKIDPDEPIEIPVSKKIVFKFAKPRKVLLY
jgi:hypothetical protein